jgi:HTH-type transcriptional regulator / antitoxin HigA
MEIKIIKTKKQYEQWLQWVDEQFEKKIKPNSALGEKLQVILILLKNYEDEHYPVPKPDPIDVLKLKMLEKGMKSKDLIGKLGTKGHVSAILNRRKALTLQAAKMLHKELGIPAEILLA